MKLGDSLKGNLALLMDKNETSLQTGCHPLNDLQSRSAFGNIWVVKRGDCDFSRKSFIASFAKAIALIVVNNKPNAFPMSFRLENDENEFIRIPSIMIADSTGDIILDECKRKMNCSTTVKMVGSGVIRDSTSMLQIAGKQVMNAFLIEKEDEVSHSSWWESRDVYRKHGWLDAGQTISCFWNSHLNGKSQCCRQVI